MHELTKSQTDVIELVDQHVTDNRRLFVLWYGGIRAGKTYGMVNAAIRHSLYQNHPKNYIVGGYVLRSLLNNVLPYFEEIATSLGLTYKTVKGGINPRIEIGGNSFLFYGGDRATRASNVQGATAIGLLLDEFELLDRDFVKQCEARISNDGALRIYTSNKGQPYSWAKREYYDRVVSGEIEARLVDSNPEENTFVAADYWQEKVSEYDDYYRKRFIENEFTLVSEPLYEVQRIANVVPDQTVLAVLYSYGKDHFVLPIFKVGTAYVLGDIKGMQAPVHTENLARNTPHLVNSNATMLGRELIKKRYIVRGYSDLFEPYKIELCQRAFASGKVLVFEDAKYTIEVLDRYAYAGVRENIEIAAIESGVEYLSRTNRWE